MFSKSNYSKINVYQHFSLFLHACVFTAIMSTITKFKYTNHLQLLWSKHRQTHTKMYSYTKQAVAPSVSWVGVMKCKSEKWETERDLRGGRTAGLIILNNCSFIPPAPVADMALMLAGLFILFLFPVSVFTSPLIAVLIFAFFFTISRTKERSLNPVLFSI